MPNAIAPGRDLIVIEASNPTIDAKGVWQGMSGSPVYYDDDLIGAVAFGLSDGAAPIVGLTAAEDMLNLPGAGPSPTLSTTTVPLTAAMTRRIALATDASPEDVGDALTQLRLPLAVSGGQRAVSRVNAAVRREGLPFRPYAASTVTSDISPDALETIGAGSSLAGGLSFGDITVAAIGTTTFVCEGRAVGFGHPFAWTGPANLGAAGADAIAVVGNGSDVAYKLANLTGTVGTIVQDRLAGIVAELGEAPASSLISSDVTAVNLNATRHGETEVLDETVLPFITLIHMASNIDSTYDQIGRGSSRFDWTVSGRRKSGAPWSYTRSNAYISWYEIAFGSAEELFSQLIEIQGNDFERVKIDEVSVEASVDRRVRRYDVRNVLTSKNGTTFRDLDTVRVRRGQVLSFKLVFKSFSAPAPAPMILRMRVPRSPSRSGVVRFRGGPPRVSYGEECFFDEDCGGGVEASSFEDLLSQLEDKPTNDLLSATMAVGDRKLVQSRRLEYFITGNDVVRLRIVR
jgi:hypothetical protein